MAEINTLEAFIKWALDKRRFPQMLTFRCGHKEKTEMGCLNRRVNGCYCEGFEKWRTGEPWPCDLICSVHPDKHGMRRHFEVIGDETGFWRSESMCWYCILDYEKRKAEEYASSSTS